MALRSAQWSWTKSTAKVITSAWLGIGLIILLFLAWRIVAHGMSDFYAVDEPSISLSWDSNAPGALAALASEQLKFGDASHARIAADISARLLSVDPLAPEALSRFGLAIALTGDAQRAKSVMSVAALQNPTDLSSHLWLYDDGLRRNDLLSALTQLDLLLRSRPYALELIGPSMMALIGRDFGARAGLVRMMANSPPWRMDLVRYLCTDMTDRSAIRDLLGRLNATDAPLTRDEWSFALARLIQDGDFGGAHADWLASLPSDRRDHIGFLYNGRFEYEPTNLPFDWQIVPSSAASVQIVRSGQQAVLKVEFVGARVNFSNVRHILYLNPGPYTFSGQSEAENFQSERGLWWRIACIDGSGASLGTTSLITTSQSAQTFSVDFVVPAAACAAQQLTLEIPARVLDETVAQGVAIFSNLSIMKGK